MNKSRTEDPDKLDHQVLDSLAQRFARARWITGTNFVSSRGFRFEYTELGYTQMTALAALLKPPGSKFAECINALKFLFKFASTTHGLRPPALSRIERELFDPENPPEIACPHCGKQIHLYIPKASPGRVTFTKTQCEMPVVQDLIRLLCDISGRGSDCADGVRALNAWLRKAPYCDIAAVNFLLSATNDFLTGGQTDREIYTMHLAIERVLPKNLRDGVIQRRQDAWHESPASERQLSYIRDLGGKATVGMTRQEASELIDRLTQFTASEKQLDYIRSLGGTPPTGISKSEASTLIEQLQNEQDGPTLRQLMVLRFWNRMDLENSSKHEIAAWLEHFYKENPLRKIAWEWFKLEQGDSGSQSDPSWVPLGIGETYLGKASSMK